MFQISFPSLRLSKLFGEKQAIDIAPVKAHDIENAQDKSGRALKHLLKLNHANHAILYNDRRFHNHAPHVSTPRLIAASVINFINFAAAPEFRLPAGRGRG
jgi:hypothetical protein